MIHEYFYQTLQGQEPNIGRIKLMCQVSGFVSNWYGLVSPTPPFQFSPLPWWLQCCPLCWPGCVVLPNCSETWSTSGRAPSSMEKVPSEWRVEKAHILLVGRSQNPLKFRCVSLIQFFCMLDGSNWFNVDSMWNDRPRCGIFASSMRNFCAWPMSRFRAVCDGNDPAPGVHLMTRA